METLRRFVLRQALRSLNVLETGLNPLKKQLEQNRYYRFRSAAEVRWGIQWGVRIDANRATVDDWLRLPGISIHQARVLVELSQSGTPLTCWDDVAAVTGIGLDHWQQLGDIVQFYYYDPDSEVVRLPVNRATVRDLAAIPAVDLGLAERLVYERQRSGPYRDWLDLKRRLRLQPQIVTALLHHLRF